MSDQIITRQILDGLIGSVKSDLWLDALNDAASAYEINTPLRAAAWLGQLMAETSLFSFVEENLNYSQEGLVKTFPKYFDEYSSAQYARHAEKIANAVYANRMGNGNFESGDGYKYRGRGLIQLTGKNNYVAASKVFGFDFANNPDAVKEPKWAALIAAWFFSGHYLNELADQRKFITISKMINGGGNGLDIRIAYTNNALKLFGI